MPAGSRPLDNAGQIVKARRELLEFLAEVDRFDDTATILGQLAAAVAEDHCSWPVRELAMALDFIDNKEERKWFLDEVRSALIASEPPAPDMRG